MQVALQDTEFPVRLRFERPMTDDELMLFCSANEPLRIERESNGELTVMTPTGSEGGGVEADVSTDLMLWARTDGRGKVFVANAGFKLPDSSVRAADAAWISWPRWNALDPALRKSFAPICPEFVIEIRSETDRLRPLRAKMEQWIANGAHLAWLIDPTEQAVTILRPGQAPEHLAHPTSVQGTGVVAGFELVMARIWS